MMAFIYVWMPFKLLRFGRYFQLFRHAAVDRSSDHRLDGRYGLLPELPAGRSQKAKETAVACRSNAQRTAQRLVIGGSVAGGLGLLAWLTLIIKSGGPVQAFSVAYSGGWDDSGYIRDGSILLLAGVLLILAAIGVDRLRGGYLLLAGVFTLPWLTQAILTSRRGPTFALFTVLGMGWYLNRGKRPPVVAMCLSGLALGWLVLFLVTNRSSIYIGSDKSFTTDVASITDTPDTGNEYIYGSGALLAARGAEKHFWGRRYAAQLLVRPIPSSIWPTKYEDFGVPELLVNAGTGQGIAETMGWAGAPGSAPGVVADLWIECTWLAIPVLALYGWIYGKCWRNAISRGRQWIAQYAVLSALSIYLVMQTMEAVIFRLALLSIPIWAAWAWALHEETETPDWRPAHRSAGISGSKVMEKASNGKVAVIWIDWYAYHIARFGALANHTTLGPRMIGTGAGGRCGRAQRHDLPRKGERVTSDSHTRPACQLERTQSAPPGAVGVARTGVAKAIRRVRAWLLHAAWISRRGLVQVAREPVGLDDGIDTGRSSPDELEGAVQEPHVANPVRLGGSGRKRACPGPSSRHLTFHPIALRGTTMWWTTSSLAVERTRFAPGGRVQSGTCRRSISYSWADWRKRRTLPD